MLDADDPAAELEVEPEVARAAKEVIMNKRKHGRKRKSAVKEADEPEQEVAQAIEASMPWRAPVARMYHGQPDCLKRHRI